LKLFDSTIGRLLLR